MVNKIDKLRSGITSFTKRSVRRRTELVLQIAEMLRAKGWNQKELAQKAGLKESYISRVFSGEANVQLLTICKLEEAFGEDIMRFPVQDAIERRRLERLQKLEEMPVQEIAGFRPVRNSPTYVPISETTTSDEYESTIVAAPVVAQLYTYRHAA